MTQKIPVQSGELEALDECLAVHGPNLARWPQLSQQRFAVLLEGNAAAQKMMREAKALEQLLWAAPPPAASRLQRLRDGAMQSAARDTAHSLGNNAPRAVPRLAAVPLPAVQSPAPGSEGGARRQSATARQSIFGLRSGLALAASLLLGIVIGAQGLPQAAWAPALPGSLVSDADADDAELAFGAEISDLDTEDFL